MMTRKNVIVVCSVLVLIALAYGAKQYSEKVSEDAVISASVKPVSIHMYMLLRHISSGAGHDVESYNKSQAILNAAESSTILIKQSNVEASPINVNAATSYIDKCSLFARKYMEYCRMMSAMTKLSDNISGLLEQVDSYDRLSGKNTRKTVQKKLLNDFITALNTIAIRNNEVCGLLEELSSYSGTLVSHVKKTDLVDTSELLRAVEVLKVQREQLNRMTNSTGT